MNLNEVDSLRSKIFAQIAFSIGTIVYLLYLLKVDNYEIQSEVFILPLISFVLTSVSAYYNVKLVEAYEKILNKDAVIEQLVLECEKPTPRLNVPTSIKVQLVERNKLS